MTEAYNQYIRSLSARYNKPIWIPSGNMKFGNKVVTNAMDNIGDTASRLGGNLPKASKFIVGGVPLAVLSTFLSTQQPAGATDEQEVYRRMIQQGFKPDFGGY
jgi:hypothetical protein